MTWFQSLNPLLVMLMTPLLLARWKRRAAAGREHSPMQKMAIGALIVAASYLLLAAVAALAGGRPRELALAGRLLRRSSRSASSTSCPTASACSRGSRRRSFGATTVAAWYLAIFTGSLAAGWSGRCGAASSHPIFFVLAGGDRDRGGRPAVAARPAGTAGHRGRSIAGDRVCRAGMAAIELTFLRSGRYCPD